MEFKENKPIYMQIADIIYENISNGVWVENQRIPSVRELAVDLEVNPNTVARSYSYVQEENIIFNKRGIGYFVCDGARDIIIDLKRNEFIKEYLPVFFKNISLLNISFEDLEFMYEKYLHDEKFFQD